MNSTDRRNRKIIDAVIRKEQVVCPGAVALIGVYGSFMTGDVHPLSDLANIQTDFSSNTRYTAFKASFRTVEEM